MLPHPEVWLRLAVIAVNATLVIALARALAGLTLALLFNTSDRLLPGKVAESALKASARNETANTLSADYAAIASWHLFGRTEVGRPVNTPPPPLPTTPLNLRLVGVFFIERNTQRALALIADGSGPERSYHVGESLPGGARLEQVLRDHIIVSRNGRQEVLNLPKSTEPGVASPIIAPPAPPDPEPSPTSSSEPSVIDVSVMAQRLRAQIATRPQALEDIAFASPYVQNGQFLGFRLRPGRDQQLLRQLGLNNGDVLTEINGNRLNSPMQGLSLLQDVMNADQISVRVLRNGAEVPLTFSLGNPSPR